MKKRFLSLTLAAVLCAALATPAMALGDMSKAGAPQIISAGSRHAAAIDADGTLWSWGNNADGQLGDGTAESRSTPVKVMDNVSAVSAGEYTMAIKADGTLWAWGNNDHGQLGDGTAADRTIPVKIMDHVTAVAVGEDHAMAIQTNGTLWGWGDNGDGELGDGTTTDRTTPVKVMDNVAAVSAGFVYTMAIQTNGALWGWGENRYGELGDGTGNNHRFAPVKIMDNAAAVSAGTSHTMVIKTDGTLWAWGNNSLGQLGDGTTEGCSAPMKVMDNVAAVSAGAAYTMAVKEDGTLWAWGANSVGQLGDGTTENRSVPIKIMDNVAAVSAGASYTMAVKTDGTLWTWGRNDYGQLGYEGGNVEDQYDWPYQTVPRQVTGVTMPKGVQLHLNGGTGRGILWTNADGTIQVPTNPTRSGYTFGGWYTDEALTTPWNFNDRVVDAMSLYARWTPVSSTATTTGKSSQSISIDGKSVSVDAYTLKADTGGDVTYVKLRDVAALLNGTSAQFDVDWRNSTIYVETNTPYIHQTGTELQPIQGADGSYRWNTAPILFDGKTAPLEGIVITDGNGGGHTFFKLRDLGNAVGFTVDWSAERGIYIETK